MTKLKRVVLRDGLGAGAETNFPPGNASGYEIQWYEAIATIAIWADGALKFIVPWSNVRHAEPAEVPKGFSAPEKTAAKAATA